MDSRRSKRRAHDEVLRRTPSCIYCGGNTPATSVEHMPPRVMFWGKRRPKGLEFPACGGCNMGSSHADLVASLFGRVGPDPSDEAQLAEFERLLAAVQNNIPGLLEEMNLSPEAERHYLSHVQPARAQGALGVGPIAQRYMEAFSLKLGLALHFQLSGRILPETGGVTARWFSNYDAALGLFPQRAFDVLPEPQTLRQGKFEVSDQFVYSSRSTDDGSRTLLFAAFREAFAVLAFTAVDKAKLEKPGLSVFSPLEVGSILREL